MISVYFFLFKLLTTLHFTDGQVQFGAPVTDKTNDPLFRDMGQAYVSSFEVVDTDAHLQVVLEDTIGVDEYWVVDFQPYDTDVLNLPVETNTGNIKPENTGDCSNVILNGPYESQLGEGFYFKDGSNFRTINVSLTGQGGNGDVVHKRLFEEYMRGNVYDDTDQYGAIVQRRDDVILFQDNFGYFFNCTDSNDNLIWQSSETRDSIEYRTTMYITNVRLRDTNSADDFTGASWVTFTVDLVYRIYRIAIVNFVISSSALVQPTLNYVIIRHYPLDSSQPPRLPQAWIKIEFETLIESPAGELLSYIDQSLTYTPDDAVATLNQVLIEDDSSVGTEGCNYATPNKCRQTWTFYIVLDLTDIPVSDVPIDATGVFQYKFEKHSCSDPTANQPESCEIIPNVNFTISLDITIQTVVSMVDELVDEPEIVLKSLSGHNGEDLRGGSTEGRRGVNHKETVTMVVGYEPELLHDDFNLLLTLFMVCKFNYTDSPGGCLDASPGERYVAFYHDDFKYIHTPDEGDSTTYEISDITGEWNPNDVSGEQQNLETNEFDIEQKVLTMSFINTALSQERLTYTITTVYKLKYLSERRRRDVEDKQVLLKSNLHPYAETHNRNRRGLLEAAEYPQGHTVMVDFVGCPPRSTFNQLTSDCDCPHGEIYSVDFFECIEPSQDESLLTNEILNAEDTIQEKEKVVESAKAEAAVVEICFALHFAILFIVYCFTY